MLTLFKPFHHFWRWRMFWNVWSVDMGSLRCLFHTFFWSNSYTYIYLHKPFGASKRVNSYIIEIPKKQINLRDPEWLSELASSIWMLGLVPVNSAAPLRWKSSKNGSQQLMVGRLPSITTQWISSTTLAAIYSLHARARSHAHCAVSTIPLGLVLCVYVRVEQKVHERGFLCVSLWVCNEQSRLKFFLKWRKIFFFWLKFWRKLM